MNEKPDAETKCMGYRYKVDLVALHITEICSHKCAFCYASQGGKKLSHPPLDQLKEVIDAIGESDVKSVCLLGGDPGAYPHIIDLSKYIHDQGMAVSILSNTFHFPQASLEEAAKYITAFEATIHDVEPDSHDSFCGKKGAYKKVIKRLRRLSELGRKTGIAINMIPATSGRLFQLVERVVKVENVPLDYIIVQRIIPFGRAANTSQFTLTRKLAEDALYQVRRIDKELGLEITIEDPVPLCILPGVLREYMSPCAWGYTKAAVNSRGDVSRCGADPRYRLGNILQTPLLEIWNNSDILKSFRSRDYLPGRCKACLDEERCGGGCPLSCEIEKDHSVDYLFLEYERLDEEIHGSIFFDGVREDELASVLQIEWSDFPGYGHLFTVESIKSWFKHNPHMFRVVRDSRNWVLGYAAIVPVTEYLFKQIIRGEISSLSDFPTCHVLQDNNTDFFHLEVLATVPSRTASRAGRYLIKSVGKYLLKHAKHVSASPITPIGLRLCKYFGFSQVSEEMQGEKAYPIYALNVNSEEIIRCLERF